MFDHHFIDATDFLADDDLQLSCFPLCPQNTLDVFQGVHVGFLLLFERKADAGGTMHRGVDIFRPADQPDDLVDHFLFLSVALHAFFSSFLFVSFVAGLPQSRPLERIRREYQ